MQKEPQQKQPAKAKTLDQPNHNAWISMQVMRVLGQPAALLHVQVRQLWESKYRVNVFVGADAASALVAHSYFLVTDGEGNVTGSTPKIVKSY